MAPTIRECLKKRFSPPEYGLLWEVRNGTGFSKKVTRSADAMAMSLWPSRGIGLIGIEIKEARGDWLRELKNPAKAEEIARYCDYWWLVTEKDVAKLDEIPKNWGWLVRTGARLVAKKAAPELKKPKRIDRLFLAALFRKLTDAQQHYIPKSEIATELRAKYDAGFEAGKVPTWSEERLQKQLAQLRESIETFERTSGVQISRWDGSRIGGAVKRVLELGDLGGVRKKFDDLADQADEIAFRIRETLKEDEDEIQSGKL